MKSCSKLRSESLHSRKKVIKLSFAINKKPSKLEKSTKNPGIYYQFSLIFAGFSWSMQDFLLNWVKYIQIKSHKNTLFLLIPWVRAVYWKRAVAKEAWRWSYVHENKRSAAHTQHTVRSFWLFKIVNFFLWSVWKNWKSFLGWVKCNRLVMTQDSCRGLPRAELQMKAQHQQWSHVDLGSKRDNGLFPLIWSNIMQTSNLR